MHYFSLSNHPISTGDVKKEEKIELLLLSDIISAPKDQKDVKMTQSWCYSRQYLSKYYNI